ncbi:hypothetical protein LIER_21943 [Lithospermum erythrorhizon]|uniref:Uncharacterized protein n=1 Tax=Lithospermum erythrorhizon TaxID=34254 RepID=A0AAV3QTA0_LITER
MELDYAKRWNTLGADLEKLRIDQTSLAKDVEYSRSAAVAATKRAEDAEARAIEAETRLSRFDEEVAQRVPVPQ